MTQDQIIDAVIATSSREVGVREVGNSNRGRRVDEYQRADLLPGVGYPWCASFQGWKMLTTLGQSLCDQVWLRSASCDQILSWGRKKGIVSASPIRGAMGLVMASKHDATHIFDVERVLDDAVQSLEGNTNDGGSRNGNGVYRRRRENSNRYLFLHWQRLLPAGASLPGRAVLLPEKARPTSPFEGCATFDLFLGDKLAMQGVPSVDGRTWVPAWKWAEWMGASMAWQAPTQSVLVDAREVPAQPLLVEGRAWLPIVKLAAHHGLKASFDGTNRRVEVTR